MYRLFLDDERFPPKGQEDDWVIVRDYDEFVRVVTEKGCPRHISWDHDLGAEGDRPKLNGKQVAVWFGNYVLDHQLDLTGFTYYVHSQNPTGKENIISYLDNLIRVVRG